MVRELADQSYAPQLLAGPILSIPYVEEFDGEAEPGAARSREPRRIAGAMRFFPTANGVDGAANVETKSRGLFKARVFDWQGSLRGEFVFDHVPDVPRTKPGSRIVWGTPMVSLLIRDPRGLSEFPSIKWGGTKLVVARGSGLTHAESGVHAAVPAFDPTEPTRIGYSIAIGVHGTESFAIVPFAGSEHVVLRADWPHPSFGGQFLPEPAALQRSQRGFEATWNVTALASNAQEQMIGPWPASRIAAISARIDWTCASSIRSTSIGCRIVR